MFATAVFKEVGIEFNGAIGLTKALYPILSKDFRLSIYYHELENLIEFDIYWFQLNRTLWASAKAPAASLS